MESLQVRGILKTLSVFIKFWNFIILYDKFSSVLPSSVLCLYYLLMLIFCCLYVVYVKVSRLNNYIHRVLLKPPSTDPPTTYHLPTDSLATYHEFTLKRTQDSKHILYPEVLEHCHNHLFPEKTNTTSMPFCILIYPLVFGLECS